MELENIKGIGPKTVNILRRLGINNTLDLVTYYPFRYDIIKRSDINLLEQDDKIIIDGVVETNAVVTYIRNHKDKMDFSLNVGEKIVKVTIFGYEALYNAFNGQVISPFIQLIVPLPFTYFVSLALIAIGILVGMFGSWRAVKKYLKI